MPGTLSATITLLGCAAAIIAAPANGQRASSNEPPAPWAEFVEPDFPFISSVVDGRKLGAGWPSNNLAPRAIVLNLGHGCRAAFDTDLLRMAAVWNGEGVTPQSMSRVSYHDYGTKVREGQEVLPEITGTPWLANGIYPGWQSGETFSRDDPREPAPDPDEVGRGPLPSAAGRFRAIRFIEGGVRLEYDVFGASVFETVKSRFVEGRPFIERRIRLERVPQPLWLALGRRPQNEAPELHCAISTDTIDGRPAATLVREDDGLRLVRVHASGEPVEFRISLGFNSAREAANASNGDLVDIPVNTARWPQVVKTAGTLSTNSGAYVVDNIAIPIDNPWRRNVRLADIGFFPDGRAAAVTFDGDVWLIDGLNEDLREVRWKRYTSGLHEPMALCVRGDDLFVFDRNGIWRLPDTDDNGEADAHELFSNAFAQTAETREYACGLRAAPDGSFIIAKGGQGFTDGKHNGTIMRVSPDGRSAAILGWGLRQAFIAVHPETGLVTATDQQGNYVPSTALHIIRDRHFHGFVCMALPKDVYPAPITPPLTWIPHTACASAAGQAWLTDARMGPLQGALVLIAYFQPELLVAMFDARASQTQAAVVSLTKELAFAPLNGAVNPIDGRLYVTGFQIWGTRAQQISGLARLRYTGSPTTLPIEVVPMDKGILLRFDVPLDRARAINAGNYTIERWNYERTSNYGSPRFNLDGSKGQELMFPSSAYLSKDGRSVFVGIPDMRPVMQMRIFWSLATRDGAACEENAYFTPHELVRFDPVAEGFEPMEVDLTPRVARTTTESPVTPEEGRRVAELMGCIACHSPDGMGIGKVGPTWKGLFDSRVELTDGNTIIADDDYLRESIKDPPVKRVAGFDGSAMPNYEGVISDAQIEALILYIKTLR